MLIREPAEMKKFASEIGTYVAEVKKDCSKLKTEIANAAPGMRDDTSRKAAKNIEELADTMTKGLPEIEAVAKRLLESAKKLKKAEALKIKR
jgi:hypothetical protein